MVSEVFSDDHLKQVLHPYLCCEWMKGIFDITVFFSAPPKIIYSSRTHSQLSQAVSELKRTTYKYMKVFYYANMNLLHFIHDSVKLHNSGYILG